MNKLAFTFLALICISASFCEETEADPNNKCLTLHCYRCGSINNTLKKECQRCINSKAESSDGVGFCSTQNIENCAFYHWYGADETGCHRCNPGFKTVYSDVDGKRHGVCEAVGNSSIENCLVYETDVDNNSIKCYYCDDGFIPNIAGNTCEEINGTTIFGKANCLYHRREDDKVSCKYCRVGYARQGDFDCVATEIDGCLRVEDDDTTVCKECRFIDNWYAIDHSSAKGSICVKNFSKILSMGGIVLAAIALLFN